MTTSSLQASTLLQYNAEFQVLICRECRYAIQKSAIDSHLLKHKIYRGDRQNLLAEIARLELREPEDVVPPPAGSPLIEPLPVLQGHRCTIADCRHLAVSEKRTKRHWKEVHACGEEDAPPSNFARPVLLQTFFRGTKVRYFEVSCAATTSPNHVISDSDDLYSNDANNHTPDFGDASTCVRTPVAPTSAAPFLSGQDTRVLSPFGEQSPLDTSLQLDLNTMKYFFHFVTATAPTLPGTLDYWLGQIASEALGRNGLLCGLLAISACHLAVLANDPAEILFHVQRQAVFSRELYRIAYDRVGPTTRSRSEDRSTPFIHQTASLLRCAQWAATESSSDRPSGFDEIVNAIRGCGVPDDTNPSNRKSDGSHLADLEGVGRVNGYNGERSQSYDSTDTVILNHLEGLPFRMAEILGKPEDGQDVLAVLAAITALIECCKSSFASHDSPTAWRGMSMWLEKMPVHFSIMATRREPAAAVVIAHWAAILVRRAERRGCWFLKGLVQTIVSQVSNQLAGADAALLDLVKSLSSRVND